MSSRVVDLFAGPGGWDVAAAALNIEPLGIEFDTAACATREAAGLRTLQADVASLVPSHYAPLWGLIASPPCQAFSMAGGGAGRRALSAYEEAIKTMWERGVLAVDPDELDKACDDPRGHLVLEPLRWAIELKPTWIALEQVEPVLPLWEAMARVLRSSGYSAWTGVLSAERYGVPQTRKRAILIARRDGVEARCPPATHRGYRAPDKRFTKERSESLFDEPAEPRTAPEDRDLLPWVSMAEALGWDEGENPAPAPTITSGGGATGGVEVFASKAARARARRSVSGVTRMLANSRKNATERAVNEPAPTITGGHDHEERRWLAAGPGDKEAVRSEDEPAPTLRFGARLNTVAWVSEKPAEYNSRDQRDTRSGEPVPARRRSVDEPAPTIAGESRNDSWAFDVGASERGGNRPRAATEPAPTITASAAQVPARWVAERPATTVNCDPRISEPGHHDSDVSGSQQAGAVRVTEAEAATLQSFPDGYPFQGTRTKRFEQIGNAIPPLLARAILEEAIRK